MLTRHSFVIQSAYSVRMETKFGSPESRQNVHAVMQASVIPELLYGERRWKQRNPKASMAANLALGKRKQDPLSNQVDGTKRGSRLFSKFHMWYRLCKHIFYIHDCTHTHSHAHTIICKNRSSTLYCLRKFFSSLSAFIGFYCI